MNRVKVTLLAAISIAMAFTFSSCGGSKSATSTAKADDGFDNISNITDDLLIKCTNEYKDHFCGVGEGISTKPSSAGEIAQGRATANLILNIKQEAMREVHGGGSVDPNDTDVSSALNQWGQSAKMNVNNVVVRDSKTQFNKEDGKYRVYRIVSVPKEEAFKDMKKDISTDAALQSTATAAVLLSTIDETIKKMKQ